MTDNKKIKNLYFVIFLMWIIGNILTLNFLPMQDPETLKLEEMIELQKQFSINFDLGKLLIKASEILFISLSAWLAYSFFLKKRATSKK
ncbi:hypothetical protein UAW_02671 [Enterococcus haemoperoxidus ATCC BAA-382]|uniref:Uncharacterized protein n=1 Tax=Enterococcus haemoperoxidus ATCC BAA-382 TaxID=1158608 RepID=R2QAJ7_9ENTE|nr:hypothetical protein [Enterococcus haemoperoxidus]EOH93422.1 hypothetical protein UAW_02671 [Enterococcus haemoperoxidus ATCC BAA-382]EOT61376.1 hypothetical protein I583_00355 [Enterococcus haemoperoxidus ATCC BAA-382]